MFDDYIYCDVNCESIEHYSVGAVLYTPECNPIIMFFCNTSLEILSWQNFELSYKEYVIKV